MNFSPKSPIVKAAAITAVVLGAAALINAALAKRAERRNPPKGSFVEVDGVRLFGPREIERCYTEQSKGQDAVLPLSTRFSLGFMLSQPGVMMGPNPHTFGHPGAGGSLGFADPDAKLGFGYAMNQMSLEPLLDPRAKALIDAAYASL